MVEGQIVRDKEKEREREIDREGQGDREEMKQKLGKIDGESETQIKLDNNRKEGKNQIERWMD